MKKNGLVALAVFVFTAVLLTGCGKSNGNLIKVQVNEVAHSILYALQYVAIELGYFNDEGLDVTLVNGLDTG